MLDRADDLAKDFVLGVSAYYHDSAAVLVRAGEIVAAAQEERFSRRKHDSRFPRRAINYCLEEASIDSAALAAVVFYDSPLLSFDRIIKNAVTMAPAGREQFIEACRAMLGGKACLMEDLEEILGEKPRLLTTQHHLAHAASCFYPSPFKDAAILIVDGVGEWATCTLAFGNDRQIEIIKEIWYPHSLGLLYSAFTYFCGFKVNSGEYKLMGLAPYGAPRYASLIRDMLIDVQADGSFQLDTRYFGYLDGPLMTNERFEKLFDGPPREPDSPITRREMDLAASVQLVIEEVVLKLVAHVKQLTGCKNLTMAGGVALNCVANGRVWREAGLQGLFIQPAAGDAGGALGAALLVSHQLLGAPRILNNQDDLMKRSYLGPKYSGHQVAAFLESQEVAHRRVQDPDERAQLVAGALAEGKVVGCFNGRMEFGPRALGAHSILGDPRRPEIQSTMNLKIKFRESFRPFAPAVLAEHSAEYFDFSGDSPYMMLVAPVRSERRARPSNSVVHGDDLLQIVNERRSDIPAVTHVDYSARVQTVSAGDNPEFYRTIRAFYDLTGCPLVVNTSFNVRGEPIVATPQDAYRCFMRTDMDLLVLEDCLVWKHEQPRSNGEANKEMNGKPNSASRSNKMNGTPSGATRTSKLAGEVFDLRIVPIAHAQRAARRQLYFPLAPQESATTYYREPLARTAASDFENAGNGTPAGLIDALAAHWRAEGEEELASLAPRLKKIATAATSERVADDGIVDVFCYTMF